MENRTAFRILDANLNRAMEALRTLEDIARFGGHSRFSTQLKLIRHELRAISTTWCESSLLASRDAHNDVGRTAKTHQESDRSSGLSSIAGAACQRIQQSLRSLEETAKLVYPLDAPKIESLRYRSYDTNAQFLLVLHRPTDFLRKAKLYVLADCQLPENSFAQRIKVVSHAGADIIQIRDKSIDAAQLMRYIEIALESINAESTQIVVNDRCDIAAVTHSHGVHVGQTDLALSHCRKLLAETQFVGLSTHDLDQVKQAHQLGADYIGCGPTFSSTTKSFSQFAGLEFLRSANEWLEAEAADLPAFAIGGISLKNVDQVLSAGFSRVAVSAAIWGADDPSRATGEFRKMLSTR